jgi:hypothetical protein
MAWTPKIDAQYIRPIIRNLRRIIERDAPDALAWAATVAAWPGSLENFKHFGAAIHIEPRFPFVLVLADTTEQSTNADGSAIDELHSLAIQVGATAANPDQLADELFIRVNAVDSIIREATWEDILQGIATTSYGPPVLEAVRHEYGLLPRRSANQLYQQVAAITVKLSYFETKLGVM